MLITNYILLSVIVILMISILILIRRRREQKKDTSYYDIRSSEYRYKNDPVFNALCEMCFNSLMAENMSIERLSEAIIHSKFLIEFKRKHSVLDEESSSTRYQIDPGFRQVVDSFLNLIEHSKTTPSELRDALTFAAIKYRIMQGPSLKT
jgi:hypothetical protein